MVLSLSPPATTQWAAGTRLARCDRPLSEAPARTGRKRLCLHARPGSSEENPRTRDQGSVGETRKVMTSVLLPSGAREELPHSHSSSGNSFTLAPLVSKQGSARASLSCRVQTMHNRAHGARHRARPRVGYRSGNKRRRRTRSSCRRLDRPGRTDPCSLPTKQRRPGERP